jgi:hypothetical protein
MNRFAALGLCLISVPSVYAQADGNKGQITGTVFDANQAVVPNAKVRVDNAETGLSRDASTNEAGQYRFVQLDPGTYNITAESQGFAPAKAENVTLTVGATVGVNLTLQVGSTSTVIDVGAAVINVALPAPSATINSLAITNLPINGRRFQDFAVLTPTVQIDPSRGQLSFAGQRGINANVMLDGADYNQPFFGGIRGGERSNSIFTIPQSAIQEFQVVTTGYSAEYGRSTGGVLNTITKSGTNNVHGEAFYQLRHKEMGRVDAVQKIASLETQHQWGGAVGGPIQRDKLFAFAAFERQDAAQPRNVLFAQLIGRTATAATQEAFSFFQGQQRPFIQTNDGLGLTARADYQLPAGHRLTLRYNFSDASAVNAVSVGTGLDPFTNRAFSNDGIEKDRTHTGTAQYTHLISPTMVNDLKAGVTYESRPRLSNSELPQVDARPIGIFGARNFLPTTQDDKRLQLSDALSIISGKHTIKLGVDYSRVMAGQIFGFNQYGGFTLASSNVDQILTVLSARPAQNQNRFDSSIVTYSRQIGNLTAAVNMTQAALFAQDSFRASNKLTLDFGIRWEGQYNPAAEANNSALISQVAGFRFPNGAILDPTKIVNSPKQFMPRFGFAYTPFGGSKAVFRGHAGLFYASTPLLWFAGPANNFRNPPGDVSILLAPTATQSVYSLLRQAGADLNGSTLDKLPVLPLDVVQRAAAIAAGGTARDPFIGAALITTPRDFRNPRAFQSGLGYEHEIFRNFVAGVQLNYINTVNLGRNRDYNLPLPTIRPTDASQRPFYGLRSGALRPLRNLGSITVRESSARQMYRAMTYSAQYRGKKLVFGAHYTFAQNFSDDDTERDATGFNYSDPFNFRGDYNYSRNDIRHQYTSYAVYTLPFGFEIGASLRARSGQVINPVTGADTNEELGSNDRPYTAPGVPLKRNSFRNRGVVNNDLRVMKSFRLGERFRLQFSTEFFNLLNLDNVVFNGANGSILTGGVYGPGLQPNGQVAAIDPRFMRLKLADGSYDRNNSQAGTPLQVQFGLRLFF